MACPLQHERLPLTANLYTSTRMRASTTTRSAKAIPPCTKQRIRCDPRCTYATRRKTDECRCQYCHLPVD